METGRKILNLRKDLGVPQKSLAMQTAVTPSALSRIESGHHQPRGPVALRIARELGVTVDYLLDDNAPYPPPAREVLENLKRVDDDDPRDQKVEITAREKALVEALRKLDQERLVLLESTLDATRDEVRYTSYLLGGADQLPGIEPREIETFRERLSS